MLRWLGLIYLICIILGVILMGTTNPASSEPPQDREPVCPYIQSTTFLRLFVCCFCSVAGGLYIAAAYKNFGHSKIDDDTFLAIVGSVSSISNGSFRYLWAHLMDKYSFKFSYCSLLALQILLMGSLYFVASSKALFLIWICLLMCCEGGHFSLFPGLHGALFGRELGARIYGVFFLVFGISLMTTYLIQLFFIAYIGYMMMFFALTALTVVSLVIIWGFEQQKPPENMEIALIERRNNEE